MALAARLRSAASLLPRCLPRIAASGDPIPSSSSTQGLRGFATEKTPTEVKVKVPLALYGGTGNYATALFIAASKQNQLDKVEAEILDIVEATKKSPKFKQFMDDLSIPRETRVKTINALFAEAGLSELTKNFMVVLAENGRLRYIDPISTRFVELTEAQRGEIRVSVTVDSILDAAGEKELMNTLKDIFEQPNLKVELKVDPSILGGLVIQFGEKLIDLSIKSKAEQMENFLRDPANLL